MINKHNLTHHALFIAAIILFCITPLHATVKRNIAILLTDEVRDQDSTSWESDPYSSSSSLISYLQQANASFIIKDISLENSGKTDTNILLTAQKKIVDYLIVGTTRTTIESSITDIANPWLTDSENASSDRKRFIPSVLIDWRIIDVASGTVLGTISESFTPSAEVAGKASYSQSSAKQWAKNKLFLKAYPEVATILKRTSTPEKTHSVELAFYGIGTKHINQVIELIKTNPFIISDSIQLAKISGNDAHFFIEVKTAPSLTLLNSLNNSLPNGYSVIDLQDKKISIGKPSEQPSDVRLPSTEQVASIYIRQPQTSEPPSGAKVNNKKITSESSPSSYHALIIGVNSYNNLPQLKTAVNDAKDIEQILREKYKFNTTLLINPDRANVLNEFLSYREKLNDQDSLLIYFAGHGWLDQQADEGYWLPANAKPSSMEGWISNATITSQLRAIQAKHILVVADSCYSGKLTRGINITGINGGKTNIKPTVRNQHFNTLLEKKSRTALSSGGLEPVTDMGENNNSIFAYAFISALQENSDFMTAQSLYEKIIQPVTLNSDQTPEYSEIRNAGHLGGDFVFIPGS